MERATGGPPCKSSGVWRGRASIRPRGWGLGGVWLGRGQNPPKTIAEISRGPRKIFSEKEVGFSLIHLSNLVDPKRIMVSGGPPEARISGRGGSVADEADFSSREK